MKTREFKRKIFEFGLDIEETWDTDEGEKIEVAINGGGYPIAIVYPGMQYKVRILDESMMSERLLKVIYSYVTTKPENRIDKVANHWYIRLLQQKFGYLAVLYEDNYVLATKEGFVALSHTSYTGLKTQFTNDEVEEMKRDPKFSGVDWEHVLERVPNHK